MLMSLLDVSAKPKFLEIMLEGYTGQPAVEENPHGLARLLNFVRF